MRCLDAPTGVCANKERQHVSSAGIIRHTRASKNHLQRPPIRQVLQVKHQGLPATGDTLTELHNAASESLAAQEDALSKNEVPPLLPFASAICWQGCVRRARCCTGCSGGRDSSRRILALSTATADATGRVRLGICPGGAMRCAAQPCADGRRPAPA